MSDDEEKPYEMPPIEWPESTREVFEAVPGKLNMRVEWMLRTPDAWILYTHGYREAAEALYAHAAKGSSATDMIVFPFAFLWRQYLELALKLIVRLGAEYEGKAPVTPMSHDLEKLWKLAEPIIEGTGPKGDPTSGFVKDRVKAFANLDRISDGFRYPTGTDGRRSLGTAPTHINMTTLHEVMMESANLLDGAADVLLVGIQSMNDNA